MTRDMNLMNDVAEHAANKIKVALGDAIDLLSTPVERTFCTFEATYRMSVVLASAMAALSNTFKQPENDSIDKDQIKDFAIMALLLLVARWNHEGDKGNWSSALNMAREYFLKVKGRHEKFTGLEEILRRLSEPHPPKSAES